MDTPETQKPARWRALVQGRQRQSQGPPGWQPQSGNSGHRIVVGGRRRSTRPHRHPARARRELAGIRILKPGELRPPRPSSFTDITDKS